MTKENTHAKAPPSEFWNGQAAICSYCGGNAEFAGHGDYLYPYRKDFGPVWACPSCPSTYVGCHPNSILPLGRLADDQLRKAKQAAHQSFDPLWKGKIAIEGCRPHKARKLGYAWLAAQLGIHVDACHIGWFDEAQCARVVEVCAPFLKASRRTAA